MAVASTSARTIRLDTDLVALLPKSFPSVQSLEVLQKRVGVVGNVVILARGEDSKKLEAFADDISSKLAALETVDFVNFRRSDDFFKDRALYYLELEDIEEIQDRIDETIRWHKKAANPLLVDLGDGEKPSLDFSHLQEKRSPLKRSLGGSTGGAGTHYMGDGGHLIGVFIRPKKRASDFGFTKKVMADVEKVIGEVDRSTYGITSLDVGGRYKKRIEQQSTIEGDLGTTSGLALLLLVLYIVFHFRRVSAVILLIVPLIAGLVVLVGIAAILFGTLNILTAFVGAILLGLGIDNGIHLLGRYQHEVGHGSSADEAIAETFRSTGRGVALAGITTAVGFSGLAFSEFRAFHEFGVIAGLGIVVVVVAYLTVLPALLAILGRFIGGRAASSSRSWLVNAVLAKPRGVFIGLTAGGIALALVGRSVEFDYDFRSLEGGDIPAYALDEVIDALIGHKQTPIIVFVDSVEEEASVVKELRQRIDEAKKTGVDFVISSSDVVPHEQTEKQAAFKELADTLSKVAPESLEPKERERFEQLVRMTAAKPFTYADLPEDIRRSFSGSGVVLVFPAVSLSDGRSVLALSDEVRGLPIANGKTVSAAGEAMVLADVLRMVFRESPFVVSLTLGLVFLSMWILLGQLRLAIFCILPALFTVFCTFGLAAILDVKLNYLNIVMLPVLFGMAVDAGVHLVTRGVFSGAEAGEALSETGHAVWGASVTTAMGFGALQLAHHPGLNSFGQLALIGLFMIVVSSLVWLTALIGIIINRRTPAAQA